MVHLDGEPCHAAYLELPGSTVSANAIRNHFCWFTRDSAMAIGLVGGRKCSSREQGNNSGGEQFRFQAFQWLEGCRFRIDRAESANVRTHRDRGEMHDSDDWRCKGFHELSPAGFKSRWVGEVVKWRTFTRPCSSKY